MYVPIICCIPSDSVNCLFMWKDQIVEGAYLHVVGFFL